METAGLGPWYVALLFNENDHLPNHQKGSKRKSAVVMHTYAHRLAGIRNALNENDNWVTMQIIGPFMRRANASALRTLWAQKVRSKAAKLQRGFDLLTKYHKEYNLQMWCQSRPADEIRIQRKRIRNRTNYKDQDMQTVRDMQKRRKMK